MDCDALTGHFVFDELQQGDDVMIQSLFALRETKIIGSTFDRDSFPGRTKGDIHFIPRRAHVTYHFFPRPAEVDVHFRMRGLGQIEDHGHLTVGLLDLLDFRPPSLGYPETRH